MATAGGKIQPIIIKRIKKGGHGGHHGGAWKIAYADFVTAMMAFFLLMWLLGSTAQGDLQGIAAYFQSPLKVALSGGSGAGDSSSLVKGGGTDLTRTIGNLKRGATEDPQRTLNLQALRAEVETAEAGRLKEIEKLVDQAIDADPKLASMRNQMRIDITPDGLRIQIVDEQSRPMFDAGSAVVKDYMRELLRSLGGVLNAADAKILLSGHTDASAYSGGQRGYSNWELSSDRANASRRELLAGGLDEGRVLRVVGMSSSVPFETADPLSPLNRRISVLVLSKVGEERLLRGGEQPAPESQVFERMLKDREAGRPGIIAAPKVPISN